MKTVRNKDIWWLTCNLSKGKTLIIPDKLKVVELVKSTDGRQRWIRFTITQGSSWLVEIHDTMDDDELRNIMDTIAVNVANNIPFWI